VTPDGQWVIYTPNTADPSDIWKVPIDGGEPKKLTSFTEGQILTFACSPDGKELSVTRGSATSDVVLISNFRWRYPPFIPNCLTDLTSSS
jgi:Tol biopolymer transport system component